MRVKTQCLDCAHFDYERQDTEARPTCTAFPGGIPNEIWYDGADHRVPFAGDHGITFTPDEEADMAFIETWDQ